MANSERERQQQLKKMNVQLDALISIGRGAEAVDEMLRAVIELERANERLMWRIMRANRYPFGRSSEKLTPEEFQQMVLAFQRNEASAVEVPRSVPVSAEPQQQGVRKERAPILSRAVKVSHRGGPR